jgi:ABC-type dipeptide/oligopeptide/nickel transport system ATPase component
MNTIVEVKNLVKKFPVGSGFFTALNGINLSFGEGEFAGLVGPSGSGKRLYSISSVRSICLLPAKWWFCRAMSKTSSPDKLQL